MPGCTRASLMCGEDSGGRNSFRRNFFDLSGFSPRASGPAPGSGPGFRTCPLSRPQLDLCPSPGPISGPAPGPGPGFRTCPLSRLQLDPCPSPGLNFRLCPGPGPGFRLCLLPRRPSLPEAVSHCGNQSCQRAVFAWAAPSAWCSLSGLFYLGGCTCLVQSVRSVSPGHPRFTQIYFPPQTPRFPSDGPVFVWLCGVKSGSIHKLFTLSQ